MTTSATLELFIARRRSKRLHYLHNGIIGLLARRLLGDSTTRMHLRALVDHLDGTGARLRYIPDAPFAKLSRLIQAHSIVQITKYYLILYDIKTHLVILVQSPSRGVVGPAHSYYWWRTRMMRQDACTSTHPLSTRPPCISAKATWSPWTPWSLVEPVPSRQFGQIGRPLSRVEISSKH